MKKIILINEMFPYLNKEPFLESEVEYYKDEVFIFPCAQISDLRKRSINNTSIKYIDDIDWDKYEKYKILYSIREIFSRNFLEELLYLLKNNKINLYNIKVLLGFLTRGRWKAKKIVKKIISLGIKETDEIIIYSYWMHIQCYIGILVSKHLKKSKVITRCHRCDIYEYAQRSGYLPLRRYIFKNVDEIHVICDEGEKYLRETYKMRLPNIIVSRLGTIDYGHRKVYGDRSILNIVSCSWIVPVKRVEKIIFALEKIENLKINWTHYGDGELYNDVKILAHEKLGNKKNIEYNLVGAVSNKQIIEDYKNKEYHIFVNVSESEGVPVSIMEAMSFGIPVIGTKVGGVPEIILDKKNGYLLEKEFNEKDLTQLIYQIGWMEENDYIKLRESARKHWENNYNAERNYKKFIEQL